MTMTFITEDGDFSFDRASDILVDTTDGYLNTYDEIQYSSGSASSLMDLLAGGSSDPDIERDEVGCRLLKSLSSMHSIVLDGRSHYGESDVDQTYVLHRLAKLAPIVSKLSDQYAKQDQIYANNYHGDITTLCQDIVDAYDSAGSVQPPTSE